MASITFADKLNKLLGQPLWLNSSTLKIHPHFGQFLSMTGLGPLRVGAFGRDARRLGEYKIVDE
jgi:hypothetical protein